MPDQLDITELMRLMSPTDGVDEQVDWKAVEAEFGTALPNDYVAVMATYGAGGINDEADILLPLPKEAIQWEHGSIAGTTAEARHLWEMERARSDLDIDPSHILAWGTTSGPDIFCWLTTDRDPDKWPVLVWGRHTRSTWALYDCGMIEFLCRVFRADFDDCPLSHTCLWGKDAPHFLHWREEQIRWQAGLDPHTNKPNPFAGMFGD